MPRSNQASLELRPPTRKEIDYYYKTHRSQFWAPERIRIAHIVKNIDESADRDTARTVIERAQEELARGEDYAVVAERYSDCGGNGEISWFPRGVMVEEFDDVVFNLNKDETSSIFETRFGFHLVKLLDKRSEGIAPLSEVRDEISNLLRKGRMRKLVADRP